MRRRRYWCGNWGKGRRSSQAGQTLITTLALPQQGLLAVMIDDLRPGFLPAIVAGDIAQGKHGVDVVACPMHA